MGFLLRPDIGPGGVPRRDTGSDELRDPIRTYALEAGLTRMKRPPKTSYTVPSLEATEYAKDYGKFDQFHKLCYEALWDEGQDLEDRNVLKSITQQCGLDWPQLEERLNTEHYRREVMRQYLQGRHLGFQGIPGFLIGNQGFTGAAPYDMFRVAAQRAQEWLWEQQQEQPQLGGQGK